MQRISHSIFCAAVIALAPLGAAHAAVFNFNNAGNFSGLGGGNFDTGTSPSGNGTADIVNIAVSGGWRASSSGLNIDAEGLDTYNLSNGGVLQNIRGENKVIRFFGSTVNINDDGAVGGARIREATFNLSGTGDLLLGSGTDSQTTDFLQASTASFTSAWTGQIFFQSSFDGITTTFDDDQDVLDWLDSVTGTDKLFLNGVALTSADVGTKFILTEVADAKTSVNSYATGEVGVVLTLAPAEVPAPAALPVGLAMLAIYGLRRRRSA